MRDLAVAVGFLTRLPLPAPAGLTPAALSRAAVWFPVVGLLVGGLMGGVRALGDLAFAPLPATVLALIAAVLATGAFHEDGLADAADAIGAHVSRARRLEILHDSRVGTYGALALVLWMLLAVSLLAGLDAEHMLRAALAGHVLGRWSTLPLSLALPAAAPGGAGALVRASVSAAVVATVFAAGVAIAAGGVVAGAVALGVACAATALGGLIAMRTLGGVSGDVFGAVNKLVEVGAYAALVAVWA